MRGNICHFVYWVVVLVLVTHIRYRDQGLTPEIPEDCPEKLAQLMKMCWNKNPNQRPVSSLSLSLSLSLSQSQSPQFVFMFWFAKLTLTLTLTLKHILKRNEMSLSFSISVFSVLIVVFLDLKHALLKLKELWNDLSNVATTMKWIDINFQTNRKWTTKMWKMSPTKQSFCLEPLTNQWNHNLWIVAWFYLFCSCHPLSHFLSLLNLWSINIIIKLYLFQDLKKFDAFLTSLVK
jgi:hypothetical protein